MGGKGRAALDVCQLTFVVCQVGQKLAQPMVALTGMVDDNIIKEVLAAGMQAVIEKPMQVEILQQIIKKHQRCR